MEFTESDFTSFWNENGEILHSRVRLFLYKNGLHQQDPDEVVNFTVLKFLARGEAHYPAEKWLAVLTVIAWHVVIDIVRAEIRARKKLRSLDDLGTGVDDQPRHAEPEHSVTLKASKSTFEQAADDERLDEMHRAIEMLPERQRQIVELHLEGKSFGEIGAALGKLENTVGKAHRRTVERLKKKLVIKMSRRA